MKTLILMRHAQAEHTGDQMPDFDRQLTPDGHNMATRTAVALNHARIRPDRIVCSAAARTRQTAEIVASVSDFFGPVDSDEALYLADSEQIAILVGQKAAEEEQTLLVVGHNPGIGELIASLARETHSVPPSTAAVFELDVDQWEELPERISAGHTLKKMIRKGEVVI